MPKPKENKILDRKPEASQWLSAEAKAHFDYIVTLLIKDKVVCAIDIHLIEVACDLYGTYRTSENFNVKKAAISTYEKIMSSFGVTYKARRALEITKSESSEDDTDDKFGDLFE